MKKIGFESFFKTLILVSVGIFLILMIKVIEKLDNGRYQFKENSSIIIDTRTGILYVIGDNGQMKELGK